MTNSDDQGGVTTPLLVRCGTTGCRKRGLAPSAVPVPVFDPRVVGQHGKDEEHCFSEDSEAVASGDNDLFGFLCHKAFQRNTRGYA